MASGYHTGSIARLWVVDTTVRVEARLEFTSLDLNSAYSTIPKMYSYMNVSNTGRFKKHKNFTFVFFLFVCFLSFYSWV